MSPRPSAREKMLDAFVDAVVDDGDRSATLEAVAERAGVSKGGLLYHFPSRDALVEGLLGRMREVADEDVAAMRAAPEGPVAYHLRTSAPGAAPDESFERIVSAVAHLAASGRHPEAAAALAGAQARWYEVVLEVVGDPAVARLVTLVADGLWFTPGAFAPQGPADPRSVATIDDLIAAVDRLVASARRD